MDNITGNISLDKLVNIDLNGKTLTGNVEITTTSTGSIELTGVGTITGSLNITTPNATITNNNTVDGDTNVNAVSSNSFISTGTHTGGINMKGKGRLKLTGDASVAQVIIGTTETVKLAGNINKLIINQPVKIEVEGTITEVVANEAVTINGGTITNLEANAIVTIEGETIITNTPTGESKIKEDGYTLVYNLEDLTKALNDKEAKIKLNADITSVTPIHLNYSVAIDGNEKVLTLNSSQGGNQSAEGLWVSAISTVDNLTIVAGEDFKDNVVEVMGSGAHLTLKNVTIKNSKQAAVYVGDSTTQDDKEVLTLLGTITLIDNTWGGIGARNGVTVNASEVEFDYNSNTEHRIYESYEDETGLSTKYMIVEPIIWLDSSNDGSGFRTGNIRVSSQLWLRTVYRVNMGNNWEKIATNPDRAATQLIWIID